MAAIVGIDLGTTNSCVSVVKDGRPKVIEDERGYNILPSCIAMKGRGRFVVGHGAKALILTQPTHALYAVKRFIGRRFSDNVVQEAMKHMSFEVLEGEHDSILLRMGDIEVTPVEASSIILKAVKEIAERSVGEEVTDAVITVPAHFTHAQRKATMEAGEMAGLNVLRLINEPTAAALAYGFRKDINKRVAIFDLGGGTFDVTILEIGDGVYEILGTEGNNYLGGEDFDYRIIDWLADDFRNKHGIDPREDREALQRLRDAAERAKCELSFVDRTPILIPRLAGDNNLEMELTRQQLEEMVRDLINEAVKITDQAMRSAGVSVEDLDEIILVGGMTRMPKIQETIRVFFGMSPCKGVHPEEVVAVGAAVHGFSLESETQSSLLLDVTPFALGMDVAGGFFQQIIEKNTTVPCSETQTFTTVRDGQTDVKIVVRQGESKLAEENELLGEFILTGIRDAEKMTPRIDVTFKIDSSGMLNVTAVDRDTGENQSIIIRDYLSEDRETASTTAATGEAPVATAPRAAAPDAAATSGVFGRIKGLFGRKKPKAPKAPPAAAAPEEAPESLEDVDAEAFDHLEPEALDQVDDFEELAATDFAPAPERAAPPPPPPSFQDDFLPPSAPSEPFGVAERAQSAPPAGDRYAVKDRDAEAAVAPSEPHAVRERGAAQVPAAESHEVQERGAGVRRAQAAPDDIAERDGDLPMPVPPDDPMAGPPDTEFDAFGLAPRGTKGVASPPKPAPADESAEDFDPFGIAERPEPERRRASDEASAAPAAAPKGRKPARLRISYKSSDTFVKEYTRNVSRGGTFIKTKKPLPVGRDCVLFLTVPGLDEPLEVHGAVVWSSRDMELEAGKQEGMGIRFSPEDEAGLSQVRRSLQRLGA